MPPWTTSAELQLQWAGPLLHSFFTFSVYMNIYALLFTSIIYELMSYSSSHTSRQCVYDGGAKLSFSRGGCSVCVSVRGVCVR
jgi:hypothetical protein